MVCVASCSLHPPMSDSLKGNISYNAEKLLFLVARLQGSSDSFLIKQSFFLLPSILLPNRFVLISKEVQPREKMIILSLNLLVCAFCC